MLRRQRAIEIVPSSKPLRWRRYDVPQHLTPETSEALRFCAVEGDLDLLDRCHRSTLEARVAGSHTGRSPPLVRLDIFQKRNMLEPWPALPRRWMSSAKSPRRTGAKSWTP